MSDRKFCYVFVHFSPREVRLKYKEWYLRCVGMQKVGQSFKLERALNLPKDVGIIKLNENIDDT